MNRQQKNRQPHGQVWLYVANFIFRDLFIKVTSTPNSTSSKADLVFLFTLLLYFLCILNLPRVILPNFPSISSRAGFFSIFLVFIELQQHTSVNKRENYNIILLLSYRYCLAYHFIIIRDHIYIIIKEILLYSIFYLFYYNLCLLIIRFLYCRVKFDLYVE